MYVFAVGSDTAVGGPIPIEWLEGLARGTDHEVWATGDQSLARETGIPGDDEALARYRERWGDPTDHAEDWLVGEEWADRPPTAPDPDVVTALAAYEREGHPLAGHQHLRLLSALFPDADHVAVRDRDVDYLEGWRSYYPWEFRAAIEDGLVDIEHPLEAPR
ncbi:hypothetical protein [Saliphagus infecundisoli]|uniref:Uncharacterized protein n=1 Tax=Saliphagus infecundisoli TaxID=1849069 RepID=A0ABD5Q9W7_9EURY|nr:hypothetical protein [Saliphagus infecundisoli]